MTRAAPAVWRWAFAASLAAVGAADAIVLDLVRAYFGSGYNGFSIAGAGQIAAFFAGGALLDAALLGVAWCGVLAGARLVRARPLRAVTAAALSSAALLICVDLAVYRLHRVLGDILELGVLLDLAAGSWRNALGQAAQDLPPLALLGAVAGAGIALAFAGAARLERWSPRLAATPLPRLRSLAASSALFAALGAGALAWSAHAAPALAFGWSEKPAGRVIRALADAATDLDRDGYGEFSEPRDPAALDPAIHPYAIEIPGNGVDEDGVGGDLPIGFAVPEPMAVPAPLPRPGAPSVVLIFLESFRGDLVGMRLDGRPITPNLDRLAAGGTAATAYAHLPITWAARGSLMQGRVVPTPNGTTLIDDFLARGYEVAWFSGQHDGLAEEDVRLGTERAGTFYDARQDVAARTTRSLQPISLQVSWKTVTKRVRAYLAARHSEAPLFLYVNVVDTHFPYWHRELDDILGTGEFPRSEIRPENRERVWRAYLNAAANVDRAIGQLEAEARAALGENLLFVVTGDHGQSFYENGLLGHGAAVDDAQTAVPLVIARQRVPLPAPIALSDLRAVIGHCVDGTQPAAGELWRREIFQHVGSIERATLVGLRSAAGVSLARPGIPSSESATPAIRVWEALNREASNAKRRRS